MILQTFNAIAISKIFGGRKIPVYQFEYKNKTIGFYHTLLGGAASRALLEEAIAKGGKKILFFGSCGSLDKSVTAGRLIVPYAAYRDEGTSYHYALESDYIQIQSSGKLAHIFDEINFPYMLAKTWTTDSFYCETENNMTALRKDGCLVIEIERASIMAVRKYRKSEVYQFLYATNCLNENNWDKRILGNMPNDIRERILKVALEAAIRL